MKRKHIITVALYLLVASVPAFAQENILYHDDINSIKLGKSVAKDPNSDEYVITLDAFVTGMKETHEVAGHLPIDAVLVLDVSNSMARTLNTNEKYLNPSAMLSYTKYLCISPNGICYCPYYYKHSDGKYYEIKSSSASINGVTGYFIYYETSEYITSQITGIRFKRRYFLGGNSTDGYNATYFTDTPYPIVLNEGMSGNSLSHYSFVPGYFSTSTTGILYEGPIYSSSRIDALREAATLFINSIKEDDDEFMTDETGHHRISVVRFGGDIHYNFGNDTYNGGVYGNNIYYSQALNPLTSVQEDISVATEFIETMYAGAVTYTHNGVTLAKYVLDNADPCAGDYRKKVVLIFTDGEPGTGTFDNSIANSAISTTKQMKDAGVEVYSVATSNEMTTNLLKFMEYMSSDYPTATSMTNAGDGKEFDKYCSVTSSGNDLTSIFLEIADQATETEIGYNLKASDQLVLDALSKHFLLPDDVIENNRIGVYTREYLGMVNGIYTFSSEEVPLSNPGITVNGKEVIVSGFNFAENWCGRDRYINIFGDITDTWHGHELVIKIPIIVDPANPGGANMTTNEAWSGIYNQKEDGTPDMDHPLKPFPQPNISLPNITIVKRGMADNNCAIFTIVEVDEFNQNLPGAEPVTVMAISNGGVAKAKLKLRAEGRYRVTEEAWSWSYTTTPKASGYAKDDSRTVAGSNYLVRNVGPGTEDATEKGTVFEFTNEKRSGIPAHDEDAQNNVFFTPDNIVIN